VIFDTFVLDGYVQYRRVGLPYQFLRETVHTLLSSPTEVLALPVRLVLCPVYVSFFHQYHHHHLGDISRS